jgi:hypothetical protein
MLVALAALPFPTLLFTVALLLPDAVLGVFPVCEKEQRK